MTGELVLGVDGGKTKTLSLVADPQGNIRGWGKGGNSDKYSVPLKKALRAVEESATQALQRAGGSADQVAAGCFGLAGADWEEDFVELQAAIQNLSLAHATLVKNDAHIALRANVPQGAGIVVTAGTHLAAALRTERGGEWHSGWFSVEGCGGAETGRKALWAVLKAYDGRGPQTVLSELILRKIRSRHPLDLLRALSRGIISESDLAAFTPLVFHAHHKFADRVAAELIEDIGVDIARWIIALQMRFHLDPQGLPVYVTGGLVQPDCALLREVIQAEVHRRLPEVEVRFSQRPAVLGALMYAYEMVGCDADTAWRDHLEQGFKATMG